MVDLFLVYQFIKKLSMPFEEWEAYEQGVIDSEGNILIKKNNRRETKQQKSFGMFDLLVLKIKRMLEKIPGGNSRIASYAAALWLIKEHNILTKESPVLTEQSIQLITNDQLNESLSSIKCYLNYTKNAKNVNSLFREEIVNNAGSGNIAGIGVGIDGEPGMISSQAKKYKKSNRTKKRLRDIIGGNNG